PKEKFGGEKILKWVIKGVRGEGTSPCFPLSQDEPPLCRDGKMKVLFLNPKNPPVPETKEGSVKLTGEPQGQKMGWVKVRRGHMALLPKGSAYQFRSPKPGVLLIQTIQGENTVERWADICQTK